jgi:hypothetical protein
VTPGNVHDSHMLQPLVERIMEKVKKPLAVAADVAYKTPAITNFLFENEMIPVLPYTRPKIMFMMSITIAISARKGRYYSTRRQRGISPI